MEREERLEPGGSADRSTIGKYLLEGELARGGVGVVMRGHDVDLGRDVAFKMLRDEYCDNPDMLQRFVEEAQIGGQLQHPGIVPVYDMGLEESRPFFSMKLVEGRTFAMLLAEAKGGERDRRRWLGVFAAVCQTVAYAHTRGIVHRDLKPSNIMVGAFGEVLVVDWGLAKVLDLDGASMPETANGEPLDAASGRDGSGSSRSQSGSVMGTPSYMSPEQANGRVEELDERTDVFALGAVLCEILTGRPPYTGERAEVLEKARDGAIAPALQRVAESGADEDLVELCTTCLDLDPVRRPSTAVVVAERVDSFLQRVEERAQEARVQVAAARARAVSEQRARRLTVGLAASVLVTIALATGGYLWFEDAARGRQRSAERKVSAAVAEARIAKVAGRWDAAVAAVRRADALLTAEVGLVLRRAVGEASSQIQIAAERARAQDDLRRRDEALLRRLDDLRQPDSKGLFYRTDWSRLAQAYRGAFEADELRLLEGPEPAALHALQGRGFHLRLAAHLDAWAQAAFRAEQGAVLPRLLALANALDADETRIRLREAFALGDLAGLKEFALGPELEDWQPTTLHLLGGALIRLGGKKTALSVYRRAQAMFPNDFVLNFGLARVLRSQQPRRDVESTRFFQAALALRPDSAEVHHAFGQTLEALGEKERALDLFHGAIKHKPGDGHLWSHYSTALRGLGRIEESLVASRKALALSPVPGSNPTEIARQEYGRLQANLASDLYTLGRHAESFKPFRESVRWWPENDSAHSSLTQLRIARGEIQEVIAEYSAAVKKEPERAVYHFCLGMAFIEAGKVRESTAALRAAIRIDPKFQEAHRWLGHVAMYSDLEVALRSINKALELKPDDHTAMTTAARVHSRRGAHEEARKMILRAIEQAPQLPVLHSILGDLRVRANDYVGAKRAYAKAVEMNPKLGEAQFGLGRSVLVVDEDYEKALRSLNRAIELGYKQPSVYYMQSLCHQYLGDYESAVKSAESAARLASRSIMFRIQLGRMRLCAGRVDAGLRDLRAAVRLGPGAVDRLVRMAQQATDAGTKRIAVYLAQVAHESRPDDRELERLFESLRK